MSEETGPKEEIAVIGGGLGGCLSALMLAKNPHYHITLIEAQPALLNGASAIASRLHLGGEYPLDLTQKTGLDCLRSAVIWKLLMPEGIYTGDDTNPDHFLKPTKFLIAQATEDKGKNDEDKALTSDKKALTFAKYEHYYEYLRGQYESLYEKIKEHMGWSEDTAAKALFGSPEKGKFFRPLLKKEYHDYDWPGNPIFGGFQTCEIGLNVPKYLAMIQKEIEAQQRQGRIKILTNHKAKKIQDRKGGGFRISCEEDDEPIYARQVVQAAWQGGPELTHLPPGRVMHVYRRGMLSVNLPSGWKAPPAFIMLGEHGAMISAFNEKAAVCYLPLPKDPDPNYEEHGGAYWKECMLDSKNTHLPEDWNDLPDEERKEWTEEYFALLKKRFPILEGATKPHLVIRDTINFKPKLSQREIEPVEEAIRKPSLALAQHQAVLQRQEIEPLNLPAVEESQKRKGLFTLYPTKATYAVNSALQVLEMVQRRSKDPKATTLTAPEDTLEFILSGNNMQALSLASMQEPNDKEYSRFFVYHPDIRREMGGIAPATSPDLRI